MILVVSKSLIKNYFFIKGLVIFLGLFIFIGCWPNKKIVKITGHTMGTTYTIKYISESKHPKKDEISRKVTKILKKVNQNASTYIQKSEISRLNQAEAKRPFKLSEDL